MQRERCALFRSAEIVCGSKERPRRSGRGKKKLLFRRRRRRCSTFRISFLTETHQRTLHILSERIERRSRSGEENKLRAAEERIMNPASGETEWKREKQMKMHLALRHLK